MRARVLWALAVVAVWAPNADAAVFHVRAGAPPGGTGSPAEPFATLDEVEAAAGPGDTIVVDPSSAALDGGIALKPGQRLQGGPGSVLTNTQASRLDGDAIRLADGVTVSGITVRGAV